MSNKKSPKLLIFGSGFISRFIAAAALDNGIEPVVLFNKHPLEDLDEVEQIQLSSCDLPAILVKVNPSYIITLQGSSFLPDNNLIIESLNANLMITILFMEKVMALMQEGRISPKKIVLVGSAVEYGRSYPEPILETFPLHPTSIYGLTKIFHYNAAMYYCEKGLPIVYTRQFNCTGPYQRADFVIPSICKQIALIEKGQKDHVSIGDITQERDFIDIRDAVQAYFVLFRQGRVGETYNIGSGHAVSISEVLSKAISLSNHNRNVTIKTDKSFFLNDKAISNMICADIGKLCLLGYKPRISIEDTIKNIIDFWRKRV